MTEINPLAGTVAIQSAQGWVTYINTKAVALGAYKMKPDYDAYTNGTNVVILPWVFNPSVTLTLPALESDGTTPTLKTGIRFVNAKCQPLKVAFSGNATA